MQRPSLRAGALLAVAGVILAIGGAPLLAAGADHLDAPALGHTSSGSTVDLVSTHGDRDINDVYVFDTHSRTRTAFVMTTNPAINLFGGHFGTNVRYIINVDRTGDSIQDLAYVWRFGAVSGGAQSYTVSRYTGANARSLTNGLLVGSGSTGGTGIGTAKDGAKVFAGVKADPFFFDLLGFLGTVLKVGSTQLGTGGDFFATLNTNAVVIEVPNDAIGGTHIRVWGQTTYYDNGAWHKADQMGRPAINTVFNTKYVTAASNKDLFNETPPSQQRTASGGLFHDNIVATLENINAILETGCDDYDATTANAIANYLLPDVITYNVGSAANGAVFPFNGRKLSADVIDAELAVTTNGCVTSDGVDNSLHTYLGTFPYLGPKH